MKLPAFLAPASAAGTQPGRSGGPRAAASVFGAELDSALGSAPAAVTAVTGAAARSSANGPSTTAGPVLPDPALPVAALPGPALPVPGTGPSGTVLDGSVLSGPEGRDTDSNDAGDAVNGGLATGTLSHFWSAIQGPSGQQLATPVALAPDSVDPAAGTGNPPAAPAGDVPAVPAAPPESLPTVPFEAAPEATGASPLQGATASMLRAGASVSAAVPPSGKSVATAVDAPDGAVAAATNPAGAAPLAFPAAMASALVQPVPPPQFGAARPAGVVAQAETQLGLPSPGVPLTHGQDADGSPIPASDTQQQPSVAVAPQQLAATTPMPAAFPAPAHQAVPAGGAAQAAPPAAAAPLAEQLARPLFSLAGAPLGDHVMTINVVPEDLGPVTVRAQLSADGIRIEMFPASDAGREGLRHILGDLRRDLAAGGLAASVGVGAGSAGPDHGAGHSFGHGPRSQQGTAATTGPADRADVSGLAAPDKQSPLKAPTGASTSLDITV